MKLTPKELQHRIDHYTAVAEAAFQLYEEGGHKTDLCQSFLYHGKADAYKNLLKELYPDIGSDRVYPLDLEAFNEQVEWIKEMKL